VTASLSATSGHNGDKVKLHIAADASAKVGVYLFARARDRDQGRLRVVAGAAPDRVTRLPDHQPKCAFIQSKNARDWDQRHQDDHAHDRATVIRLDRRAAKRRCAYGGRSSPEQRHGSSSVRPG
jgi:hypothetical protein